MPEVTPFFAVPFGFALNGDRQRLHQQLRDLFAQRAADGKTFANPRPFTQRNGQLFESRFDLFYWPEPCVQELKSFCLRHLLQLVCELSNYDAMMRNRLLIYHDAWFHITRRGGFFGLHNHPNASWSGVYCIEPGNSDADKPESGLLSFMNPAIAASMHLDAGNAALPPTYSNHMRHLALESGQLVLFPSWVLHDVKPYEGDGERITVAFNCWFGLKN